MIWITHKARKYLAQILNENMHVFEYGSGDSTIFFSALCKNVVTVEHDLEWFNKIPKLDNVELIHCAFDNNEIGQDKSNPDHYKSNCITGNFKSYVNTIDNYNPDLIFIDGRARCSCLRKSFEINPNYIVLDNTERPYYTENLTIPDNYEIIKFYGHGPKIEWAWETTFFINKEL